MEQEHLDVEVGLEVGQMVVELDLQADDPAVDEVGE